MQEFVFFIEGDVTHPLTVDPTVWIFDERKVDLDTYFDEVKSSDDEETAYKKAISAQWDKEITEGSEPPRPDSNDNKIKYDKQKLQQGSFGMPLKPFLLNAEPKPNITKVEIIQANGLSLSYEYSLVQSGIIAFSHKGKPLKSDGPIHFYFGDGTNRMEPIKNVSKFILHQS